jgi:hypothetical protein
VSTSTSPLFTYGFTTIFVCGTLRSLTPCEYFVRFIRSVYSQFGGREVIMNAAVRVSIDADLEYPLCMDHAHAHFLLSHPSRSGVLPAQCNPPRPARFRIAPRCYSPSAHSPSTHNRPSSRGARSRPWQSRCCSVHLTARQRFFSYTQSVLSEHFSWPLQRTIAFLLVHIFSYEYCAVRYVSGKNKLVKFAFAKGQLGIDCAIHDAPKLCRTSKRLACEAVRAHDV